MDGKTAEFGTERNGVRPAVSSLQWNGDGVALTARRTEAHVSADVQRRKRTGALRARSSQANAGAMTMPVARGYHRCSVMAGVAALALDGGSADGYVDVVVPKRKQR